MTEERYRRAAAVVVAGIGGHEAALFDQRTQRLFTLNETGRFLWDRLGQGASPAELAELLLEEFEVARDEAEESVAVFLGELLQERLVETLA